MPAPQPLPLKHADLLRIARVSATSLTQLAQASSSRRSLSTSQDPRLVVLQTAESIGDMASRLEGLGTADSPVLAYQLNRIKAAFRTRAPGDRRAAERFPFGAMCRLELPSGTIERQAVDIGALGVQLAGPVPGEALEQDVVTVHLPMVGPVQALVKEAGHHGLNLQFTGQDQRTARQLDALLLRLIASQTIAKAHASEFAITVEEYLTSAIEQRLVTEEALFDVEYQLLEDCEQPQLVNRALPLLMRALKDVPMRFARRSRLGLYACTVDRNGWVPLAACRADKLEGVLPDGLDPDAWWGIELRSIRTDVASLHAARFSRRSVVQPRLHPREGLPDQVVLEAAAPINVHGRRWGCALIGLEPATDMV